MDASSHRSRPQSLGTCLLNLRPGDPCPCCGARLQDAAPTVSRHPTQSMRSTGGDDAAKDRLVCIECGCELTEVAGPFESGARRDLSPAA
jgi:hypothetical protein